MVDPVTSTRLGYQAAFVGLAALVLFVRALPLSAVPAVIPAPDLLLCLAIAWVLRRPDFIPVVVIVAVFLMEDILSMRPPGLWTLIVLFGTEFLRSRATLTRDLPFLLEWAMVGAGGRATSSRWRRSASGRSAAACRWVRRLRVP